MTLVFRMPPLGVHMEKEDCRVQFSPKPALHTETRKLFNSADKHNLVTGQHLQMEYNTTGWKRELRG